MFSYGREQNNHETLVVPDLHGDLGAFLVCLYNNKFIDKDRNWIAGTSRLVLLGDIINRGRLSKHLLDYIIELADSIDSAGGEFVCLRGNHELFLENALYADLIHADPALRGVKRYGQYFLNNFGIDQDCSLAEFRDVMFSDENQKYIEFLKTLKVFYKFDNFLVVHGCVNAKWANVLVRYGVDYVNNIYYDCLQARNFSDFNISGTSRSLELGGVIEKVSPLWFDHSDLLELNARDQVTIVRAMALIGVDNVLCGHQRDYKPRTITLSASGKDLQVTCLDTSMSHGYEGISSQGGMLVQRNARLESGFSFEATDSNGTVYTNYDDMRINE
jgi:hypothetical protein